MIKQTCTRRLQFCAGHRVYGHENKCMNMHGHNYVVLLEAEADKLDNIGRVIDFKVLKERFGGWIDDHWDHAFIFDFRDKECNSLFLTDERFITQKYFKAPFNPTAEEMARYLLFDIAPMVLEGTNVRLKKVVLFETENCFAEASIG